MAKLLRLGVCNILLAHRCIHSEVRVRFAPSPTGFLHLGGLRTALYNFLYARQHNGKFLLRIEDTDQSRLVPGATESIIEDLQWVGIEVDEGPGFGGERGPYIQSERRPLYDEAANRLLDNGAAYKCFCSERRLELLRKEAMRVGQVPRYDNKCRHLSVEESEALAADGRPHCVRFQLSAYDDPIDDLIYGSVVHDASALEGDPIIVKSDGFPTYHFANVVDDHHMGITHVFRGIEWQISTVKHLLLYRAFGWLPPRFAHLPLLVNADGTKLSKRQGDISVSSFRAKAHLPLSLLNFITSAGGGFHRAQNEKPKISTLDEMIATFDVSSISSHPSRLNPDTLNEFGRLEIIRLLQQPETTKTLVDRVQGIVRRAFPHNENLDLNEKHVEEVLRWSVTRIYLLTDLVDESLSFLWTRPSKFDLQVITQSQLARLISLIEECNEFKMDNISRVLKSFAKEEQLKYPAFMKVLRSALSGLKEGPGVAEMIEILGKPVVLQRLHDAAKLVEDKQAMKSF